MTFGTDETQKTISVTILDDDLPDTGETFTVLLSDPAGPGDGARLGNARATGRIRNHESDLILTGLTLVDAADQSVLAALSDGATVTLDDPDGGSFGIRADAAQGAAIGSVRLELTGAKTESTTDNGAPYSLYGDDDGDLDGESLPVGFYTLRATAYAEIDLGGDVLQTLEASFTVEESVQEGTGVRGAGGGAVGDLPGQPVRVFVPHGQRRPAPGGGVRSAKRWRPSPPSRRRWPLPAARF